MLISAAIRLSKARPFAIASAALVASFTLAAFAWPRPAANNAAALAGASAQAPASRVRSSRRCCAARRIPPRRSRFCFRRPRADHRQENVHVASHAPDLPDKIRRLCRNGPAEEGSEPRPQCAFRHARCDRSWRAQFHLRDGRRGWSRHRRHGRPDGHGHVLAQFFRRRDRRRRARRRVSHQNRIPGLCAGHCSFDFGVALPLCRRQHSR